MDALVPQLKSPQPLSASVAFNGVRVSGVCIPPPPEDLAYSGPETFKDGDAGFIYRRASELHAHGITEALAPNVSSSTTRILNPDLLTTVVELPHGIIMRSNPAEPADMIPLNPRTQQTFYMRSKGCGALVMVGDDACLVGHLSRWNAIDHGMVSTGARSREFEGLLHAGACYFDALKVPRKRVQTFLFFAIAARSFSHSTKNPGTGKFNRKLQGYVRGRGYSDAVMQRGKGNFSFPAYVYETCKMLGLREPKSLCTLPDKGRFSTTRHEDERLRNSSNSILITVDLVR